MPACYLTPDVPPLGGRIKDRPEDFLVEELPLYDPCGEGEHVYLFVEKRGLSTTQLVWSVARHFGVPKGAVGYAGMKDKDAITRQVLSVHTPGKTFRDFPEIRNDRARVLWADMHTNKLRLGHLRGNRFSVRIRGVEMTRVVSAQQVLAALERSGVPNFAGEQRFGVRQNNHTLGRLMLLGDHRRLLDELLGPDERYPHLNAEARRFYAAGDFTRALDGFPVGCRYERCALAALERGGPPKRAVEAIDVTQRRFWFTAFQSAIFNAVLARRLREASLDRLVVGDLAVKHENGALFGVGPDVLADPGTPARLANMEISPSGPLWGSRMMRADGPIGEIERRALEETGVPLSALEGLARGMGQAQSGARRALRVPLRFPEIEGGIDEHGHFIRCAFELPPGAFATVVMREIMKTGASAAPGEEEAP